VSWLNTSTTTRPSYSSIEEKDIKHLIMYRVSIWLRVPFLDNWWRLLQSGQWKSKLGRCWTGMSITWRTRPSTRHQRRSWTIRHCCHAWRHWPSVLLPFLQRVIAIIGLGLESTERYNSDHQLTYAGVGHSWDWPRKSWLNQTESNVLNFIQIRPGVGIV